MSLECGIVGLPNVGKSTLFNTLTSAQVAAENFPFCTVDPNRGIVPVPDPRQEAITKIAKPQKIVPATTTFVDIAGLVKGASKGEGLGNQFLSHIRGVDAIAHVVRCFEDSNITHVMGNVDPKRDVDIIDLELCMADLDSVSRKVEKVLRLAKSGNTEAKQELNGLEKLKAFLNEGTPLRRVRTELEGLDLQDYLTAKPLFYLANLHEDEVRETSEQTKKWVSELEEYAKRDGAQVFQLSVSLEYQLSQFEDAEEKAVFLEEYGLKEPGLDRLIREAYRLLGLITFFTAGEKEVRAWTIHEGDTAVDAAGAIHSDFARGFIRAETIHYDDFVACKGEKGAREKGLQRSEGRDYRVHDGDIILFRFNV